MFLVENQAPMRACGIKLDNSDEEGKVVGDLGIEPSVRLREGVTVPCHTLRPVAHFRVINDVMG